ncbi:Elongation factor G, III-V domain-containing protein [Artemisia annua]|uniref:Elongation factor G, III-V domain-containing protein n=1 Tax=Artemisia annua TaxID=35608 RepID=A0A2U1QH40_ARTAN|nr:Elongation factor G, III-V domain-containing protein [Artemisia annua]
MKAPETQLDGEGPTILQKQLVKEFVNSNSDEKKAAYAKIEEEVGKLTVENDEDADFYNEIDANRYQRSSKGSRDTEIVMVHISLIIHGLTNVQAHRGRGIGCPFGLSILVDLRAFSGDQRAVHEKGQMLDLLLVVETSKIGGTELVQKTHLLCLLRRESLIDCACGDPLIQPYHTWAHKCSSPQGQVKFLHIRKKINVIPKGYRMSLWAEHIRGLESSFEIPESLECTRHLYLNGFNDKPSALKAYEWGQVVAATCRGLWKEWQVKGWLFKNQVSLNAKDACKRILDKVGLHGSQIGKTKSFLRAGQLVELDVQKAQKLSNATKIIQRRIRTHIDRRRYLAFRKSAELSTLPCCSQTLTYGAGVENFTDYTKSRLVSNTAQMWSMGSFCFALDQKQKEGTTAVGYVNDKVSPLRKALWGLRYFIPKTKMIMGKKGLAPGSKARSTFVQFVLEPLWQVYEAALDINGDKGVLEKLNKLNTFIWKKKVWKKKN